MQPKTLSGSETIIDVKQWLKDNKLSEAEQYFIESEITIEELIQFTETELSEFGKDIGLDTLQKRRFIKAIEKLQNKNQDNSNNDSNKSTANLDNTLNPSNSNVNLLLPASPNMNKNNFAFGQKPTQKNHYMLL